MILVRRDSGIEHITQLTGPHARIGALGERRCAVQARSTELRIGYFNTYDAAFAALSAQRVDDFLADKILVVWFAQQSGHAADIALPIARLTPGHAGRSRAEETASHR